MLPAWSPGLLNWTVSNIFSTALSLQAAGLPRDLTARRITDVLGRLDDVVREMDITCPPIAASRCSLGGDGDVLVAVEDHLGAERRMPGHLDGQVTKAGSMM